ncbi:MAG: hypothetical protein R3C45_11175 [Phycisphaerales bacterium]
MIIEPVWFLYGVAIPLAIALAIVWALSRGRDARAGGWPTVGWALGIGLATFAALLANTGLPPWKPIESTHWLVIAVAPGALLVALLGAWKKVPRPLLMALRVLVAAGIAPVLLQPMLRYSWDSPEATAWLSGLGLAALLIWGLMHLHMTRHGGVAPLFVLGATAAGVAACTVMSGSITAGQLAGSFAVGLGGAYLATLKSKSLTHAGPAMTDAVVPVLLGLLINSWMYSWRMEHEPWAPRVVAVLFAIAPLGLWAGRLPAFQKQSEARKTLLGVCVTLGLIALALGIAGYEAYLRSQANTYDYY